MNLFKKIYIVAQFFLISQYAFAQLDSLVVPIVYLHAHNDYEKIGRKPLFKALEAGATSVEIDLFPMRNGQLKIAHIPLFLFAKRNFEATYLKPLASHIKGTHNKLYTKDSVRLILMIDLKRNAAQGYASIRKLAMEYESLFTIWYPNQDSVKYGPVELLVSGHKPWKQLLFDSIRYMRIDGGLGQIGDTLYKVELAPRVSARYGSQFKWRGKGAMPAIESEKLKALVRAAHADGRQIRFWAMPNNLKVWQAMRDAGVDWLNVDKIRRLKRWHEAKL